MEDISENETCITISSDNGSPSKTIEHKPEDKICSSIVLTDTELEEGEISEDEEEPESKETKKNDATKPVVEKSNNKVESSTNSNTNTTKRKLNENVFETNKKGKYSETSSDMVKKTHASAVKEFPWSELRVLVVGDERIKNLDWKDWNVMPVLETSLSKHCNLETLCSVVEKNLYKEYDVVVVFSFHHDFVNINEAFFENTSGKIFMDLKSDVNIIKLLNTVQKYHLKWERQFPNTYVIWTLPYPPDFLKFNSVALKGKNCSPEKTLNEKSQNELTRNYYALAKKFLKDWKSKNKQIPIFPLTKVLFIKKHCYKKSFEGSGTPKFPRGYLIDGLYPSKLMVLYIAYLLIEFLVDYEFYPENKYGLDLKEMETRFEEIDPLYAAYFHNDKNNSTSHKKSKKHSHHSRKRKKHKSPSPLHRHSKSRSRSRRRRSRSSSRHSRKRRSSSRRRRKSYSRSRSSSLKRNKKKAHSNSSNTRNSKLKYSQSDKDLSCSLSPSSISSDSSSVKTESHNSIHSKEDKDSKDEVSFFRTLRYLREVHEIQCKLYRRKPHTHPLYNIEKEKFMKKQNSKLPLEFHLPKWEKHWKEKMEKIFEETWAAKKEQLTIDLNKKGSFTSLHNDVDISSTALNLNDGQEGQEKKRESISNFINKFDLNLQLKKSLESVFDSKKSDNFTLADIFKGTHPQDLESAAKKNLLPVYSSNVSAEEDNITSNNSHLKTQQVPENPQVNSDSESESESIKFDDSDLDVDEILENPDFLEGLEEIDRELQSSIPEEKNKTETSNSQPAIFVPTSSCTPQNDLSFLFRGNEKKKECKDNLKEEFINVLKMLYRVSKRLGPLGLSVSALYTRVSEELQNNKETFQPINSDSNALLLLVGKKLNSFLKEDLPEVQKAIYGEIAERLQSLLRKVNTEEQEQNPFPKVNIISIAAATVGQELTDVISFIRNTLLYHGYTKYTNDDVMNIYMSVKASQLDMEKK